MRSFSPRFANSNAKLSRSNSSASEFKTSTIEIKKSTLEIEIDLWNELSMSLSISKQLQNDIVDLFRSQQKSLTSVNRKTQYMFSSLDALMLNSHANAHNKYNQSAKCEFAAKRANMSDCEIQRNEKAKSNEKFAKRS